jgi:hypothetical protein
MSEPTTIHGDLEVEGDANIDGSIAGGGTQGETHAFSLSDDGWPDGAEIPIPDAEFVTIYIHRLQPDGGVEDVYLQASDDGGETWDEESGNYHYVTRQWGSDGTDAHNASDSGGADMMYLGEFDQSNAAQRKPLVIEIAQPHSPVRTGMEWRGMDHTPNDSVSRISGAGTHDSSDEVDMIRLFQNESVEELDRLNGRVVARGLND